ncbi:MAG: ABC-F family ATP-binding cassette domain-containing protein [Acidobacteria bacterium]|nr:ABC-F family ATP-binding cassette domain-containing protein [Acidobacteriota bacterium]
MLQIRDLNYHIGDRQLLAGINWVIQPGKRAALVGPNGAGKTTLLRILNEEIEYHDGSIIKPKDYRIGYLPQEEISLENQSVLQTVLNGQKEIFLLEKQIAQLHETLDTIDVDNERHENLLDQLGTLEHYYEAMGGYRLESQAKTILSGLGFFETDLNRPLAEFSGGWRMRVYLALLLLRKPDLLLMDEPTNHLDIPSLEWLEQYLLSFKGSIVIVSHDRFFIDRLAQEIVELDRGRLVHYSGNYHFYETEKELRETLLLKKWKEQKEERERQERFISRFRYKASKAAQVQSRIKQLEKMTVIDIEPPPPRIDFTIKVETPSYKDVLTLNDMSFKYDAHWVLRNINLNIYRGDRVCLIGVNGAGKTTLTRLITGQLVPQQGSAQTGPKTLIGYYAQHQVDTLDLEACAYDEIASTVASSLIPRIRDVLGIFQFRGDDVYKKIKVLSGGEKARVSLAKILLSPVNFLIMDEPTNHLDKTSREALEQALSHYDGTLLLISHDRYFLDKLVNRVWELSDGQITGYDGNYSYYLEKRSIIHREISKEITLTPDKKDPNQFETEPPYLAASFKKSKEQKRLEAEARQAISKDLNRLKKEVADCEDKINKLETAKKDLEFKMAQPQTYQDSKLAVTLQKEYATVKKDLQAISGKWEVAQIALDELANSTKNI